MRIKAKTKLFIVLMIFCFQRFIYSQNKPVLSLQFSREKTSWNGINAIGCSFNANRSAQTLKFLYDNASLGMEFQFAIYPLKRNENFICPYFALGGSRVISYANGFKNSTPEMKQYFSGVQLNFGTTISIWKNFDVFCQLGPSYIYANMYTYLGRYKFQGITPSGGAGIIYYLFKGGALLKDPRRRFPCLDSAHTKALYFLKPGGCRQEYDYRSTHGRYLMFSSEARMLVSGMGILAFSAAYPLLNRIHPFLALDLNAGFDRSTGDFGFDFLSTRAGARFIAAGTNRVQFVPSLSFGLGSITFQQQLRPVRTLTTFVADLSLLMRFRLSDFLWLETGMGQYSITPVKHGYSDFGSLYAQAGVGLRIHTRKKVKVSGTR